MRLTPERKKEIEDHLNSPHNDTSDEEFIWLVTSVMDLLNEVDALTGENLIMKNTLDVCKNAFPLTDPKNVTTQDLIEVANKRKSDERATEKTNS